MQELVSILMPTYNNGYDLEIAIDSCLDQFYTHFELLILDNSSNDETRSILESYSDKRIRLILLDAPISIAEARNKLLKEAKGAYIAWLDGDDSMIANRLKEQVTYMKSHPKVDILGSWILTDDALQIKKYPIHHKYIKAFLWFRNCMVQPSVLSRNFYVKEDIFYDASYGNSAEDYELWYRLSKTKVFANLPDYLILYHVSSTDEIMRKRIENKLSENLMKLWEQKWKDIPVDADLFAKNCFIDFLYQNKELDQTEINAVLTVLNALKHTKPNAAFRLVLAFHFLRLWRNMKTMQKLKHAFLLKEMWYYPAIKNKLYV
jgi:glycosyltransferase involved in cell wall biosynthesis